MNGTLLRPLAVSLSISTAIFLSGLLGIDRLSLHRALWGLGWPLFRLLFLIGVGLFVSQWIEATGWTRALGVVARPLFRFGNLGDRCSAAFTTAFVSGVAANAMLIDFYKEGRITRKQLFLSNFINQLPAYFLHLPTTFFIILPLTRLAGFLYLLITFCAAVLRTALFLVYGHLSGALQTRHAQGAGEEPPEPIHPKRKSVWREIRNKIPGRMAGIVVYVVPIYCFVFVVNEAGAFGLMRTWLGRHLDITFLPVEAVSVVVLSFTAEFSSGFAAAGALMDAGVLTTQQTVLALLIGNMVAFPVRALRHQLPRYMGIYSPKMGAQLLLMGQGFRLLSLIVVGALYYGFL